MEFRQTANIAQRGVETEPLPAGESGFRGAFEPRDRFRRVIQDRIRAGDLVIRVMRMAKRPWGFTSTPDAVHRWFELAAEGMQ